jgi:integrase
MASTSPWKHDARGRPIAWRVYWRTPDGKKRSKVFDSKRDADLYAANAEVSKSKGNDFDPRKGRQRFRDYAQQWADAADWKPSTRRDWPKFLNRLEPHIGGLRLADIDRNALERTRAALTASGLARSTVEATMRRAMAVMRYAYANGVIGRDPTVGVKAAPKQRADDPTGKVGPDNVPTREEALAILNAAPSKYRAAVALGLAGLRIGEVLGMEWDRVNLATRQVTIDRQSDGWTISTPKNERTRTITVPELVATELRRHRRDYASDRWLFPGGGIEGTMHRASFYKAAWQPALKAAGMPGRFKFHSLRHFAASSLLAAGVPLPAVAGQLGDVVETVSKVYSHWLRDDAAIPADALDRVLAPSIIGTGTSVAPVLSV